MKTRPIGPANIVFGATSGEPPYAPDYGDIYHPQVGALAQGRHVFLQGNGLPLRWAGRARFVILETGFGLGNNFLATWQAWRDDGSRCERLVFVSIEAHPPRRADLARAHAGSALGGLAAELVQAWPPLTPNLHALDFDAGRVQLLLALGDVAQLLPALRLQADAFFLDGFAPARNPEMWQLRVLKALGRKAAPGATLATWSVASELRAGLVTAGFEVQRAPGIGGKREITVARWAPRFEPRSRLVAGPARPASAAIVVGAGIAGAAVAQAFAAQGVAVTVLDRHAEPASEASGNPAGLFHGTVNGDDGTYARLYRAAALQAQRSYGSAFAGGHARGSAAGLLRLELELEAEGLAPMQSLLARLGLPSEYVQAVDAQAASLLAGVPLAATAWHYPGGGWIDPASWVRQALAAPGVRFSGGVTVARIARGGGHWQAQDEAGRVLAQAPLLVLACAASAARLLAPLGHPAWPLERSHGQVTHWADPQQPQLRLRLPVAGDGYVLPLPAGGLLCGASRGLPEPAEGDAPRPVSLADHRQNLQRLLRLAGISPPADPLCWQGRTGWRLHAADRLPIAGAVALPRMPPGQRLDQVRMLPREEGLFVLTALGSRGLTLAPLLARLVAAQATGAPWPLEQDLADAIDPARWWVRAARQTAAVDQAG